jgi:hypothetical protein
MRGSPRFLRYFCHESAPTGHSDVDLAGPATCVFQWQKSRYRRWKVTDLPKPPWRRAISARNLNDGIVGSTGLGWLGDGVATCTVPVWVKFDRPGARSQTAGPPPGADGPAPSCQFTFENKHYGGLTGDGTGGDGWPRHRSDAPKGGNSYFALLPPAPGPLQVARSRCGMMRYPHIVRDAVEELRERKLGEPEPIR